MVLSWPPAPSSETTVASQLVQPAHHRRRMRAWHRCVLRGHRIGWNATAELRVYLVAGHRDVVRKGGGLPVDGQRDRDAFTTFWRAERDRLYRALSLTIGDADLAADAVDEAMARAWQRWSRIGGYDRPEAWVFRVAYNSSVSWRRKRARRVVRPVEELDQAVIDGVGDPDLLAAVQELPPGLRATVVLRFLLDWLVDQAAEALGVAEGTVRSRTHRALEKLEQMREVTR
jgi:RNA polymerase sigma-70 factor (ECF subfamily)